MKFVVSLFIAVLFAVVFFGFISFFRFAFVRIKAYIIRRKLSKLADSKTDMVKKDD